MVILVGNTAFREIWSSGEIQSSVSERRWIKKYQGTMVDVLANEPLPGAAMATPNQAYAVEDARVTPLKGGMAELTVLYSKLNGLTTINQINDIEITINWIRDSIPFTYAAYIPGSNIEDVIALIDDYLNSRSDLERATLRAQITGLGNIATRLLKLKSAGITAFPLSRPIVRRTKDTLLSQTQMGAHIDMRETPDVGTEPYPTTYTVLDSGGTPSQQSWEYVKMDDSNTKTGRGRRWRRTEEWHGLYLPTTMDTDLRDAILAMYPAVTP